MSQDASYGIWHKMDASVERFAVQRRARRTNGSLMLLRFPCGGIVRYNGLLAGGPSPVVERRDIAGVGLSVFGAAPRGLDFVAKNVKQAPPWIFLVIARERADLAEEPVFDRADRCECCLSFPERRTIGSTAHGREP